LLVRQSITILDDASCPSGSRAKTDFPDGALRG
jgi:hypothetical protein